MHRKIPACERCRKRKTRCDSDVPSCQNCLKANKPCMNLDKVLDRLVTRSYAGSLVDRVRAYEERHPLEETDANSHKRPRVESLEAPRPNQISTQIESKSPETVEDSQLENEAGSDSELPYFHNNFDNTSRNTIQSILATSFTGGDDVNAGEDLHSQIRQYSPPMSKRQMFIENEKSAIAKLGRDFLKYGRRYYSRNKLTDISAYDYNILVRLARRYIISMNSAYPVLHECMVHLQLEKCRNRPTEASYLDKFQIKMVIAIALASISRSQVSISEIGRIAHVLWKSATKNYSRILTCRGLEKVQNILLLIQYTLLVPRAGNLWQLLGTAMRLATEIGLYSELNPSEEFDPLTLDLRRRVFWTCYCIDRTLATVMGRPTGIPDAWITTQYPALVEDCQITVSGINPGVLCHLKVAQIQCIRTYRLQSEIHRRLYAAGTKEIQNRDFSVWSWQMYDQLRFWRSSYCHAAPLITKEWIELQFHLAVVLLFRPSPNRPKLSSEAVHVAFHSAGQVMKLVKVMHRDDSAVCSWITVQNLFMCGLTFVNSLKELAQNPQSNQLCISFFEIFSQIQSCSTMLETLSTVESGTYERIRNAFEMVSSSVLQSVANIAPYLPRDSSNGCIWAVIAKSDDISVARPEIIEGFNVPIAEKLTIGEADIGCWETEEVMVHFHEHDIDNSSHNHMLEMEIDLLSYRVGKDERTGDGQVIEREKQNDIETFGPEGLGAVPNIGENIGLDLDAELSRWFLHPFPELAEPSIQREA